MKRKMRRRGPRWAAAFLASVVLLLIAFHYRLPLAKAAASALSRPATLERSDVIFVMGGFPQSRLTYAVDLFDRGYGDKVWAATTAVSRSHEAFGRRFGFRIDEQSSDERALSAALPEGRWRVLPGSFNTWTDLELLKKALAEEPASSVLIVSSPLHFRRIEFCLRKIFGKAGGVRFRYAYPAAPELDDTVYAENLPEAAFVELGKNVAYRLKYGL